jgi:membrane protease YdiL (CAAX protease family)
MAIGLYGLLIMGSIAGAWIWLIVRKAMGLRVFPQATPRTAPWGLGTVILVIVAYLFIQFLSSALYAFARSRVGTPAETGPGEILLVTTLVNLFVLAFVPLILARTSGAGPRDFGFGWSPVLRDIALGVWLCFFLAPFVYAINMLLIFVFRPQIHPVFEMVRDQPSSNILLFAFATAVLVAPVVEELLFRGVLLGWLTRALGRCVSHKVDDTPVGMPRSTDFDVPTELATGIESRVELESPSTVLEKTPLDPPTEHVATAISAPLSSPEPETTLVSPAGFGGPNRSAIHLVDAKRIPWTARWGANVLVSLLFAGLHYKQWPAPVPLFVLSLGLGYLAQRTGSLVAPTTMHAAFNGLSTGAILIIALSGGLPYLKDALPSSGAITAFFDAFFLALTQLAR